MKYSSDEAFSRTAALIGSENMNVLLNSHVIVCGLGGVGSYVAESLARSGVGILTLVDFDHVTVSNINRQIPALVSSLDHDKADVMAKRVEDINPNCQVRINKNFIDEGNAGQILAKCDYVVDAIDHIPGKIAIIEYARIHSIPVVSAMGAALRLAPENLRIADISQSQGCSLARSVRRNLRERGIVDGVTVVYSLEKPFFPAANGINKNRNSQLFLGSMSFVPGAMGLMIASVVVRDLCGILRP